MCIIMSQMPQAVWKGGRVKVSSGFRMEKAGRSTPGTRRLSFCKVFVCVMTELPEPSLPEAGMVSTTPTFKARFTSALPMKKSQKSPS